jgi:hypothetical protein
MTGTSTQHSTVRSTILSTTSPSAMGFLIHTASETEPQI